MIDQKQIPPEVVEAAREAFHRTESANIDTIWCAALAAGLAAWPGMEYWPEFSDAGLGEHEPGKVFLPLTDARDD